MMAIAQCSVSDAKPAAVVLSGRRSRTTPELTKAVTECGAASTVVVRSGGRRRGATEGLIADLLGRGVETAVVSSLAVFHPTSVAAQLSVLATLLQNQIRVLSLKELWVSMVDPTSVALIAGLLAADEQRRSSRRGRTVVARLRQRAAPVGRPRKPLTVTPDEARRLVTECGWRQAARRLSSSPATLRRALMRAGLLPAPRRAA